MELSNDQDNIHFKLEQDDNGKWWRYCTASEVCIEKRQRFEKRRDMERHLKVKHAFEEVHVPSLPLGRPKEGEQPSRPVSNRSRVQCEKRFYDEAYKAKKAKAMHIQYNTKKYEQKWEKGNFKMSKKRYVEKQVKREVAMWEKRQASRTKMVQERVLVGYEKSRRKKDAKSDVSSENEASENEQDTPDEETSHVNNMLVIEAPKKLRIKRKQDSSVLLSSPPRQLDFTKQSPQLGCNPLMQVEPSCSSFIPQSPEVFVKSLRQGVVYHMRSTRFDLTVNFHASSTNNTMDSEASTNTMNTFALWMENMLSITILDNIWFVDSLWKCFLAKKKIKDCTLSNFFGMPDLGHKVFTFFPLLDRSHWTLMVLFNPHCLPLPRLPQKRSCILYFDSLGMSSPPSKYFDCLYRAFVHFASFCTDPIVKMELLDPKNNIGLECIEIAQQPNAHDCGYYVMTCMHFLIEGGLIGPLPKDWLSRDWFKHEDVSLLKQRLFYWIENVVGAVN